LESNRLQLNKHPTLSSRSTQANTDTYQLTRGSMNKHLVIFDLDNTLVVTQPAAKDAYKTAINYLAKQHGIYQNRFKLYNHWKKIVQKVKTSKDPQKRQFEYSLRLLLEAQKIPDTYLSQALAVYEKEYLQKLSLQNGAKDILTWIKQSHSLVAIATETPTAMAKKKLKVLGLKQFIDILITSNHTGTMKPDSTFLTLAIKESGVKSTQVVVVGDGATQDLAPAKKLKLKTILIPSRKFNLNEIKPQLQAFFEVTPS